ncbi:MAG: hypothetical protein WC852_05235, partial [Candidatus Nanoarchaeia archaeon]
MVVKGKLFEKLTEQFSREIFEKAGYLVIEVRSQKSGTQYGFDVLVKILDNNNNERSIHLECKDYSSQLNWKAFLDKILQLDASPYVPDIFIGLSPKASISNVNHSTLENLKRNLKFPIRLWSPDTKLEELFAINNKIYQEIYGNSNYPQIEEQKIIKKFKTEIDSLLDEMTLLKVANKIIIKSTKKQPVEDISFRINLDKKLDACIDEKDP